VNEPPGPEAIREILLRYEEPLLREVAGNLVKPRSRWPVDDLIDRCVEAIGNAAVVDRRLQEADPAGRQLLALLAKSRQPFWRVANLVELLAATGHAAGVDPVVNLCRQGLLFPALGAGASGLRTFEQWLVRSGNLEAVAIVVPSITDRAGVEEVGLPGLAPAREEPASILETDGLDWPLRLAVLWQQVREAPLRLTQQGGFFKRDFDRLRTEPLLAGEGGDAVIPIPDAGLLAVSLARALGIVQEANGELRSTSLPPEWDLPGCLVALWTAFLRVGDWDPGDGWQLDRRALGYRSAYLLALLMLGRLSEKSWAAPEDIGRQVCGIHPFWAGQADGNGAKRTEAGSAALTTFLLGVAHPLRLVQIGKSSSGRWLVRLSAWGRWLLKLADSPPFPPAFPKTLLVQPNLEVVVYRQGLSPFLIGALSQFAVWKTLGSACTLQIIPESVYHGLESGWTFDRILQVLERHGMRPTPLPVIESLRTWANKRERLTVYPSAALLEFASAKDLEEALARGLQAVRLADRLAVAADEAGIDYRQFRLSGTRDYSLPPDRCVAVESDGVTLTIDIARADLLLETELTRFAEFAETGDAGGGRRYCLSMGSLARARESGVTATYLEEWFLQRTGGPMPPAARLLLGGIQTRSLAAFRRQMILHVESAAVADGLVQWPATRRLISQRLGPTALVVPAECVDPLRKELETLGLAVALETSTPPTT
jgi:hypothetical protein